MKYTISYLLGSLVLFPLLLYGVNMLFFSPREVTNQQVEQYINDSLSLNETIIRVTSSQREKDPSLGHQTKTITHFLDRRGRGNQLYYNYICFSKKYKKYIRLIVLVEGGGLMSRVIDEKELEMTVNKSQWEDSNYGTKENPIPVLKFVGVTRSLRSNNLDYNKQYMDKVYHETVQMYLTYLMPKSEFKQTFKKD